MKSDYFIVDGENKTYDKRDLLKALKCKWDPHFKCWVLIGKEKECEDITKIKALGLEVQWAKDTVEE